MKRALQLVVTLALLMAVAPAEVIDRIIATVNGDVVLESELQESIQVQRLMSRDAEVDRGAELERLIDRSLIRQQMERSSISAPEEAEISARLAELRRDVAPQADDAAWSALLAAHGLTEADLRAHVALQLAVLRFVELRFRPSVYVSDKDVEQYYAETFVPEMRRNSAEPPPLRNVLAQIREVIVQQRVDELLSQWLRARRAQMVIRRFDAPQNARTPTPSEQAAQGRSSTNASPKLPAAGA
jgi:peptidyl-prolyl cis-trans isomerase SurA